MEGKLLLCLLVESNDNLKKYIFLFKRILTFYNKDKNTIDNKYKTFFRLESLKWHL